MQHFFQKNKESDDYGFLIRNQRGQKEVEQQFESAGEKKRAVLIMVVVIKIYTWAKTHGTIHNTSPMVVKQ